MKARGLSLLEIMLIIGVTAIIMIVAVNYFTNVRLTSKINQTIMQVRDLYQGGVSYFNTQKYQAATHGTTGNIILDDLIKGNYIPTSDQFSPWGSNQLYQATLTFSTAINGNKLTIIVPPLPNQACTVITNRLISSFPDAAHNGNTVYSSCSNASTKGLTITFTLSLAG